MIMERRDDAFLELAARIAVPGVDDRAADIFFGRFDHDGAPHLGQPCSHSSAILRVDQPSRLAAFQTMPNSSPASPSKTSSRGIALEDDPIMLAVDHFFTHVSSEITWAAMVRRPMCFAARVR